MVLASLIIAGCSAEKSPGVAERPCAELPALEHAVNLKLGESCGERVAEIRSIVGRDTLVRRFVLRPADSAARKELPKGLAGATVLGTPVSRVVALSSAQLGYALRLGEGGRIVAVGEGQYVYDSTLYARVSGGGVAEVGNGPTLSLEKLMALKPQLVMSFATGGGQDDYERIEALGLPLMLTSEWQEEHPLAKAEWIKLYGMLFGVETLADSIYKQSKSKYLSSLASRLSSKNGGVAGVSPARGGSEQQCASEGEASPNKPEVEIASPSARNDTLSSFVSRLSSKSCPRVLVGMSYGGVWYAPGGNSYTAQLIKDAGGCYLWANDSSRELKFSLEEIIALADSADIWINPGMFSTPEEILAAEPRAARIKAFKEKRVYQNDGRKGPGGGNDFYESAVAYPEKLLREMSQMTQIFAQNADSAKNAPSDSSRAQWYRNIFNF